MTSVCDITACLLSQVPRSIKKEDADAANRLYDWFHTVVAYRLPVQVRAEVLVALHSCYFGGNLPPKQQADDARTTLPTFPCPSDSPTPATRVVSRHAPPSARPSAWMCVFCSPQSYMDSR